MKKIIIQLCYSFPLCVLIIFQSFAQKQDFSQIWPAQWIQAPESPLKEYAAIHFRKEFNLEYIPDTLIIHTSGDTRYQLFVNGSMVTWGPQTGDLRHWYYESTNISSFLVKGKNVIAAIVLNYGSHPPDARLTVQTAFLLASDNSKYNFLNSNNTWKAAWNKAYAPNLVDSRQVKGYYGGGSREIVNGNLYPWGWQDISFDQSSWSNSEIVERAYARTCKWASRWKLTPSTLEKEKLNVQRFKKAPIYENIVLPSKFPGMQNDIKIPPNTKGRIVLDHGEETTAYPVLELSGGKHAKLKITYSEAPYIGSPSNVEKGNRNELMGKSFFGYYDQYTADGTKNRKYSPIWWRAFRFLVLDIETFNDSMIIHDIHSVRSAFPFDLKSSFKLYGFVEKDIIDSIFDIGIRTTKLCAHDTYIDCPYYEESQFEGDTRIEILVSYFNFGNATLAKNAIEQFSWSANEDGFLSARYPTNSLYYIPNFSVYWIGMLYDYMMYNNDPDFLRNKLAISRNIIQYFSNKQREDGSISKTDYHNFVDWSFKDGEAPIDNENYSALTDLHFLLSLQWAKALEEELGESYFAHLYDQKIRRMMPNIRKLYWNSKKGLFKDTKTKETYSQHTNSLAILTGVVKGKEAEKIMMKVLSKNESMTQASLYWSFYLFEALKKAGLSNLYLEELGRWKDIARMGASTWPETGLKSRSECHGWGASPNYHFFKNVAGIESMSHGFKKIQIAPAFGKTESIHAIIPHPNGKISLNAQKTGVSGLTATIELPQNCKGELLWLGKKYNLVAGIQVIKIK